MTVWRRMGLNSKWPMSLQKVRFAHRHKYSGRLSQEYEHSTNKLGEGPRADLFPTTLRENWTSSLLGFSSWASGQVSFCWWNHPHRGSLLRSSRTSTTSHERLRLCRPALVSTGLRKLQSPFYFDNINYLIPDTLVSFKHHSDYNKISFIKLLPWSRHRGDFYTLSLKKIKYQDIVRLT